MSLRIACRYYVIKKPNLRFKKKLPIKELELIIERKSVIENNIKNNN